MEAHFIQTFHIEQIPSVVNEQKGPHAVCDNKDTEFNPRVHLTKFPFFHSHLLVQLHVFESMKMAPSLFLFFAPSKKYSENIVFACLNDTFHQPLSICTTLEDYR